MHCYQRLPYFLQWKTHFEERGWPLWVGPAHCPFGQSMIGYLISRRIFSLPYFLNQKALYWFAYRVLSRGGVESNQTNFELIFLEFFELKKDFPINRIENLSNQTNRIILRSNRTNRIILRSNRISNFQCRSISIFSEIIRIFSKSFKFFRIFPTIFSVNCKRKERFFQSQTFLWKYIILSSFLERKDNNAIEIVLMI